LTFLVEQALLHFDSAILGQKGVGKKKREHMARLSPATLLLGSLALFSAHGSCFVAKMNYISRFSNRPRCQEFGIAARCSLLRTGRTRTEMGNAFSLQMNVNQDLWTALAAKNVLLLTRLGSETQIN
jgi:hypothetical protein